MNAYGTRNAEGVRPLLAERGLTPLRFALTVLLLGIFFTGGCAGTQKKQKLETLETNVTQLRQQLSDAENSRRSLQRALDQARADLSQSQSGHAEQIRRLLQDKEQETDGLVEAQRRLAISLKKELDDSKAKLEMTERGLVLTLLDEIFFDSGKAVIKEDSFPTLDKVAKVLKETVPDSSVAVEGHTDTMPIKYSGWLTNWELSSGRALAVVHYFIDQQGVASERMQAVARGEFHPVAPNTNAEGRRQNRRVEVVILPSQLKKDKLGR